MPEARMTTSLTNHPSTEASTSRTENTRTVSSNNQNLSSEQAIVSPGATVQTSVFSRPPWQRLRATINRRRDHEGNKPGPVKEESVPNEPESVPESVSTRPSQPPSHGGNSRDASSSSNSSVLNPTRLWHDSPRAHGIPQRGIPGQTSAPSDVLPFIPPIPDAHPHVDGHIPFSGLGENLLFGTPPYQSFRFPLSPQQIYSIHNVSSQTSIPRSELYTRSEYVAGNPFRSPLLQSPSLPDLPTTIHPATDTNHSPFQKLTTSFRRFFTVHVLDMKQDITTSFDGFLRQTYHSFFLRLPAFYFIRVTRIFQEVHLNTDDLRDVVIQHLVRQKVHGQNPIRHQEYFINPAVVNSTESPHLSDLIMLWEGFIDSLMREWKTINIVAVMLLTAIISTLQIGAVFSDPVVRNILFVALICGLMSVIYGCMYMVRFSGMRRVHRAVEWAKEGASQETAIFWNAWVLLAMPAVWLAWTLLLFITVVVAFVWRASATGEVATTISPHGQLVARVTLSLILFAGMGYLVLILRSLRRYGEHMDIKWTETIKEKVAEAHTSRAGLSIGPQGSFHGSGSPVPVPEPAYSVPPIPSMSSAPPISAADLPPHQKASVMPESFSSSQISLIPTENSGMGGVFKNAIEVVRLNPEDPENPLHSPYTRELRDRDITWSMWLYFVKDITHTWNSLTSGMRQEALIKFVKYWNHSLFHRYDIEAVLSRETPNSFPRIPWFTIYLTDLKASPHIENRLWIPPDVQTVVAWNGSDDPPHVRTVHEEPEPLTEVFTRLPFSPTSPLASASTVIGITVDPPSSARYDDGDPPSFMMYAGRTPYPTNRPLPAGMPLTPNDPSGSVPTINPISNDTNERSRALVPFSGSLKVNQDITSLASGIEPVDEDTSPSQDARTPQEANITGLDQLDATFKNIERPQDPVLVGSPPASRRHVTFAIPEPNSPSTTVYEEEPSNHSGSSPESHSRNEEPSSGTAMLRLNERATFSDSDMVLNPPDGDGDDIVLGPLREFPDNPLIEDWRNMLSLLQMFQYTPTQTGFPLSVIYIDLRQPPHTTTFTKCSERDLALPVTMPPVESMRLVHESYPESWRPITIRSTRDEGVSTSDLINQIWEDMNTVVTPSELEELGPEDRLEVIHAHHARITASPVETLEVRRVDFLKGYVIFSGLLLINGLWEIKSRQPDEIDEGDLTAYIPVSDAGNIHIRH